MVTLAEIDEYCKHHDTDEAVSYRAIKLFRQEQQQQA